MLAALFASSALGGAVVPSLSLVVTAAALAWLARGAVRLYRRRRRRLRARGDPRSLTIGNGPHGEPVRIPPGALREHGLIVGATGSGKSTTMLALLRQEIAGGHAVVAIDLKGSRKFAVDLAAAAQAQGRRFILWTPDGPSQWNPLAHGNPTELKDKLIATERFTEPHYQRAAERYLQRALSVFAQCSPRSPTLVDVVSLLDPATLGAYAVRLGADAARDLRSYLAGLGTDQQSAIRGLQSRLALLTESHAGRFLGPGDDLDTIDLRASMDRGDIVLFSLSASSYGQSAGQIGTLVVQDLVSVTGARMGSVADLGKTPLHPDHAPQRPVLVAIDEFSALSSDHVLALLARGREPGVGVVLATQELADLDRAGRGFRDQVIGNAALKIAHRQDVPASAHTVAQLGGTTKVWERTYREATTGFGSRATTGASVREVERFRVEPNAIANLRTGEALVIVKSPAPQTTLTRIDPRAGLSPTPGRLSFRPRRAGRSRDRDGYPPAPGVIR